MIWLLLQLLLLLLFTLLLLLLLLLPGLGQDVVQDLHWVTGLLGG